MKTNKIGIITCSNATQELDCCSVSCLRDLNKKSGNFKRYNDEESLRLIGIISCAGCPTKAYPDKILRKVSSLVRFGVTSVHFSYCMVALCPFLPKYIAAINKAYPDLELIQGTHEAHITYEQFCSKVVNAIETNHCMSDIILGNV